MHIEWNARNQLVGISGGTSFVYDGAGRRQSKTIGSTTTAFLHDGLNPVQEQAGSTTTNLLTGLGIDEFYQRAEGTTTETFFTDALGTTVALTDGSGSIAASYTYEAFGATAVTGTTTNPYEYTGRESDGTGLKYYRARYYDTQRHRFISEDPVHFDGGDINVYAYVGNNPINFLDPPGLGRIGGAIRIVRLIGDWMRTSKHVSLRQAQNTFRRGGSVRAPNAEVAEQIARGVAQKGDEILHHSAHRPGYRPHFQIKGRSGRVFYNVVPFAGLGEMVGRKTGIPVLGHAIDFVNPMSDIQDLFDVIEYVRALHAERSL